MILDRPHSDSDPNSVITLIKRCAFFNDIPINKIRKLLPLFEKSILKKGDSLFYQGDHASHVYVLTSGQLVGLLDTKESENKVVEIIEPVEIVGELEVISRIPRSLTVKAITHAELLSFPGEVFVQLYQKNQQVTLEVMKLITRRSVETIKLIAEKKRHKFIVIFPTHEAVPLGLFIQHIKKNLARYPILFSPQVNSLESLISVISNENHQHQHNHFHLIIIKDYQSHLFKFLFEHNTHFFLLGEGNQSIDLNQNSHEILASIKSINHKNLSLILLQKDDLQHPQNTQSWFSKADFKLVHHIKENDDAAYARFIRFAIGKATGLVLSGGGMRGFAHLGVLKALTENKIPIDMIAGVSIGASAAAYYAIHPSYEHVLKASTSAAHTIQNSFSFKSLTWPVVSLFNGAHSTLLAKNVFKDLQIEDAWIPFFCISANISLVKETIHRTGSFWEAVRSSNAVPGLMPPIVINGQLHCDGGLMNNLPVDVMRNFIGSEGRIIASRVSNLAKDNTYYNFPPIFSLKEAILYQLGLRRKKYRVPYFLETFVKSMLLGASAKEEKHSADADLLIHPNIAKYPTYKIKSGDEEKLINAGYQETIKQLEQQLHGPERFTTSIGLKH